MAERKRILIPLYASFKTSAALVIYVSNLIKGLNHLEDKLKPEVIIYHNEIAPIDFIAAINYPYIDFFDSKKKNSIPKRVLNHYSYKFFNKFLFTTYPKLVDIVFPAFTDNSCFKSKEFIHWKADFQEQYYPQYFTKEDLNYVRKFFENLKLHKKDILVLSSNDAANDFKNFYPEINNATHILQFVSFLPSFQHLDIDAVKRKFNITAKKYFIVCNQFWPHKNHITVLKAIKKIKDLGNIDFQVVFTGATSSHRSNSVFPELQNYIIDNNLKKDVIITGFLEREEQLILMKNALAVIQPTYFEGWSTVIEDAKAMNQYVIASDISVNQEQIQENVTFFDPDNVDALQNIMLNQVFEIKILDYNIITNEYIHSIKKLFNLDTVSLG